MEVLDQTAQVIEEIDSISMEVRDCISKSVADHHQAADTVENIRCEISSLADEIVGGLKQVAEGTRVIGSRVASSYDELRDVLGSAGIT